MAKVSSSASLGMRIGVGHIEGFQSHDAVNPFSSYTIEREYPNHLTDADLEAEAEKLKNICQKLAEKHINNELKDLKKPSRDG